MTAQQPIGASTGLSVVIPALNEEAAIAATVEEIRRTLDLAGILHEIVVVDDGSSDGTGARASASGARVIRHVHNLGYGRSLKDGIVAAQYPTVAITDADGTYPIEELPRLIAIKSEGYDMVVGARTGKEYRQSIVKMPLRRILKFLVEFTAGRKIPDINSGMRIFDRDKVLRYADRLCDTFSFTTSLTLAFIMNGHYVTHTAIAYHPRIGTTKVRLFSDSVRTLQYIGEAAIYYNPLRIFMAVGLSLAVVAALLAAVNVVLGRTGILMAIIALLFASILVFALGLIAVLLKQILDRTQQEQRPVSPGKDDGGGA